MAPNAWCAFTLALLNEFRAARGADDARAAAAFRGFALQGVTVLGEEGRNDFGAPSELPKGLVTAGAPFCVRLPAGSSVTFGDSVELADAALAEAIVRAPFTLYDKEWRAQDTPIRAAARTALDRMGLDPREPRATRLLVPDGDVAPELLAMRGCRGEVVSTTTSPAAWTTRVRIDSPGAVRLAVAWSPMAALTVDGDVPRISPVPDVTGGTVVALERGEHEIVVAAQPIGASRAWWLTAALAALLVRLRFRRAD